MTTTMTDDRPTVLDRNSATTAGVLYDHPCRPHIIATVPLGRIRSAQTRASRINRATGGDWWGGDRGRFDATVERDQGQAVIVVTWHPTGCEHPPRDPADVTRVSNPVLLDSTERIKGWLRSAPCQDQVIAKGPVSGKLDPVTGKYGPPERLRLFRSTASRITLGERAWRVDPAEGRYVAHSTIRDEYAGDDGPMVGRSVRIQAAWHPAGCGCVLPE